MEGKPCTFKRLLKTKIKTDVDSVEFNHIKKLLNELTYIYFDEKVIPLGVSDNTYTYNTSKKSTTELLQLKLLNFKINSIL